jgi:hypothetical protein
LRVIQLKPKTPLSLSLNPMETLPSAGARSITAEPQVILALGRQPPRLARGAYAIRALPDLCVGRPSRGQRLGLDAKANSR